MEATEPKKKLPYLIVGQGIAGTLLAWFLEKAGQPFLLIDNEHQNAASVVAAGIINPITGRRFVKSWMIEKLLPFAKETYQTLEKELRVELWEDIDIIRFFSNAAEGNNWLSKTNHPAYQQFLKENPIDPKLAKLFSEDAGYGTVRGAKVNIGLLVSLIQKRYLHGGWLLREEFDHSQLTLNKETVTYRGITAAKIIFCEGYRGFQNPWFHNLPFESAKGEVLIVRIPELQTAKIIKKYFFFVPLGEDLYWFGSNYSWDFLNDAPTKESVRQLEKELKKLLPVPYEILYHKAAVRPVLKDRRPVLGTHPGHAPLAVFNGLGTKGTSIAPYWAFQLVQHLLNNKPISPEVDIGRFF